MASVIKMDSKEFLGKFLDKFGKQNTDFQFIVVSEFVKTSKKKKVKADNVYDLRLLMPAPSTMSIHINKGYCKKYKKSYMDYLRKPDVDKMICLVLKGVVENDFNIIFLCSKTESEYKYLDLLCEYIEEEYGIPTNTYKDLKNDYEETTSKLSDKDKKKIGKIITAKLKHYSK